MAWFNIKKDKSQPIVEAPECPNSDSGKHLWQVWTDDSQLRQWRSCETSCGALEEI